MTPEERELLKKSLELAEENNEILRNLQRAMRWGRIFKIFYWVIIVGTAIGAFYFIQPYLDTLTEAYGGAKNTIGGAVDTVKSLNSLVK